MSKTATPPKPDKVPAADLGGMDLAAFDAMTEAEAHAAALSDPDAQPSTPEQIARMQRVSPAKRIRLKLGLKQEDFAKRFRIPLGTLRDWEQHRAEPDQAARAYLQVIEREPEAVGRALDPVAAE